MDRFTRIVVGYHGCAEPFASELINGGAEAIQRWRPSENDYDWLGTGIYFWEHSDARAFRWAKEQAQRKGDGRRAAVVGAIIQLGRCFDLTDERDTALLAVAHDKLAAEVENSKQSIPNLILPVNKGRDADLRLRYLDCAVINFFLRKVANLDYQTVRGAFSEGPEAFPGAAIRAESHIQIAVRDPTCILGVFRPNLRM